MLLLNDTRVCCFNLFIIHFSPKIWIPEVTNCFLLILNRLMQRKLKFRIPFCKHSEVPQSKKRDSCCMLMPPGTHTAGHWLEFGQRASRFALNCTQLQGFKRAVKLMTCLNFGVFYGEVGSKHRPSTSRKLTEAIALVHLETVQFKFTLQRKAHKQC